MREKIDPHFFFFFLKLLGVTINNVENERTVEQLFGCKISFLNSQGERRNASPRRANLKAINKFCVTI